MLFNAIEVYVPIVGEENSVAGLEEIRLLTEPQTYSQSQTIRLFFFTKIYFECKHNAGIGATQTKYVS